jgi:hypothetical protein
MTSRCHPAHQRAQLRRHAPHTARRRTVDDPRRRQAGIRRRKPPDAIADTALRYVRPAVPKSFREQLRFLASTSGVRCSSIEDKRGGRLFSDGTKPVRDCSVSRSIECQSAPQAGRGLYAEFLDDAAAPGAPQLAQAAAAYRETSVSGLQSAGSSPAATIPRSGSVPGRRRTPRCGHRPRHVTCHTGQGSAEDRQLRLTRPQRATPSNHRHRLGR